MSQYQLNEKFLDEATCYVVAMQKSLRTAYDDPHALIDLWRDAHAIHTDALMMRCQPLAKVAAVLERLVSRVTNGMRPVTPATLHLIGIGIGVVRTELDVLRQYYLMSDMCA